MTQPLKIRHDGLWLFMALTYAVSWLPAWIPAALTGQTSMEFPTALLFLLGGFGPSLVGVFLTYRCSPPDQRRDFWRRTLDFRRIRPVWYALLFLTFPLVFGLAIGLNALLGGEMPEMGLWNQMAAQPLSLLPTLIITLLAGPISEELGWRGFALDRMARRWGLLRASLVLGIIWWGWHLPLFFIRGTTHHTWGWGSAFFWLFLANVIPLSLIIAWAYERNQRSILAAVLAHFMYNFVLGLFFPFSAQVMLFTTMLLYVVAAGVVVFDKGASAKGTLRQPAAQVEG